MTKIDDEALFEKEARKICGGASRGHFYNLIGAGCLPQPRKLGRRSIWFKSELIAAMRDLPRGEVRPPKQKSVA